MNSNVYRSIISWKILLITTVAPFYSSSDTVQCCTSNDIYDKIEVELKLKLKVDYVEHPHHSTPQYLTLILCYLDFTYENDVLSKLKCKNFTFFSNENVLSALDK